MGLPGVMTRRTWVLILGLLTAITMIYVMPVNAQSSKITIDGNGDVIPSVASIPRDGNVYSLTANLNNTSIIVEANNIVIDGANHVLGGLGVNQNMIALNLTATNVTVQDMHICNWKVGVLGAWNNNAITNNTLTNNGEGIVIYGDDYDVRQNSVMGSTTALFIDGGAFRPQGDNNFITQNRITSNTYALDILNSDGTTIKGNDIANNDCILVLATNTRNTFLFYNNFTNNTQVLSIPFWGPTVEGIVAFSPAGQWDNGTLGNYWSDYQTTYRNATEIDHTGIGNTPYLITSMIPYSINYANGTDITGVATLGTAIDNHPLMASALISKSASTVLPNSTPAVPEVPVWTLLVTVLLATYAVVLLALKHSVTVSKRLKEQLCSA